MTAERKKTGRKPGTPKTGGRRPGTPNKVTAATRERIESEADPIGFLTSVMHGEAVETEIPEDDGKVKTVSHFPSLEQRINAAKWLGHKITPDAKDEPVRFELPEIEGSDDLVKASLAVLQAVSVGELSPSQGQAIAAVIESHRRTVDTVEILERLKALEGAQQSVG